MSIQEQYAAAAIGATVAASASSDPEGLDRFEAEWHWLNEQAAAGRVRIIKTTRESFTTHHRPLRVLFKRLA